MSVDLLRPGPRRGRAGALLLAGLLAAPPAAASPFDLPARIEAAAPGSMLEVPAGVHTGPILLDRPLVLVARTGAVLQGTGKGDVLRITAPDVTVRGFVIRGTGISLDQENAGITVLADRARIEENVLEDVLFGIYLKDAKDCVVRANRISGKALRLARRGDAIRLWHSSGSRIEENVVSGSRDVVIWFSEDVRIIGNVVRNGRYGLHFMYSDGNVIEDNRLEGNSVGAFLMYSRNLRLTRNVFSGNRGPSGYGVGLKDMDGVVAEGNRFVGNRIGVYLDNSPWSVDVHDHFTRNIFAYNDIGVAFQPAVQRNMFRENTFLENLEQVAVLGAGDFHGNRFTVDGRGNFWSDYRGYDLDGDGLGDVPYRAESLFETLIDRETKLRLFLYSPAQQAIEMAARALPAFRPRPKLTDTAPLTAPVPLRASPVPAPSPWPLGLVGAGLLLGAVTALRAGKRSFLLSAPEGEEREEDGEAVPGGRARPDSGDPVVRVRSLRKRFGKLAAVDGLGFEVARGEAVALWGRNGAGKTTAIKCVLGLLSAAGRIEVEGHDLGRQGKKVRRALGYVPQELAFHDDLRTRETLAFYASLKNVPASRAAEVLEEVGMAEHACKRIGELSGGMKQRVALAAALLADPPVLVLDELTSNLDAGARAGFLELLLRQKDRGKTILYTSHRIEEVRALADRVLVIEKGKIRAECRPEELPGLLGLRVRIKLFLEGEGREDASDLLRAMGFTPRVHGAAGVWVQVPSGEKTAVLRALEAAGLRVKDFEIDHEVADDAESRSGGGEPGQGGD